MKKGIKVTLWLVVFAFISVILHNFVYLLTKKEEGFFFTLTFVFLAAFIASLFYNFLYSLGKNKKDENSDSKK